MGIPCEVITGQLSVRGISLGGVETCMQVPQLDLMFDVGRCARTQASTPRLFMTHAHGDHTGGLIGMLNCRTLTQIKQPLEAYAPAHICDGLRTAVTAYESIQGHPYRWNLTPVEAGQVIALSRNREVRAFRSVHVIPCLGYTVVERVQKLRDEFKVLEGQEIARRKLAGEDLFDTLERPILSFPGDTTIKVLDQQPHLYQSRVLLLETTYIDDRRTVKQCREHGHIHLDEVLERADLFNNEHLVFTHFSQAYSPPEIRQIIADRCAGRFKPTVHVFAPRKTWPG